jgi:glyoxylase-like metal-dependent hydrolase (beta-lactamase superfamily II)
MPMRITDNVYFYKGRKEEKIIRGAGSCNVIVLKTDRQAMVDSGLIVGGSFRALLKASRADGLDLSRTQAVLHTHCHWDHIIGDRIVQWKYGAKVYAHPWGRPSIESQKVAFKSFVMDSGDFYQEVIGSPPFVIKMLLWYIGGSYSGILVDEMLEGVEELDFGLKVLACHTPGHTPGHIGYYIPEGKVFAAGDLIDLETGNGADLNNPYSNYADGLASLENVRKLDIEYFLPSHGEPVRGKENVQRLLDRMIENTHKYVTDVTKFLSKREGTLTEIFNRLMPHTPFTLKAMKITQILTVLKYLQEKGQVNLKKKEDRLVWSIAE